MTKSEVIKSSHIYIQNHFKNLNALSIHIILILTKFIDLLFGSIISSTKSKILMNCLKYWKKGLINGDWSSDRAKSN